MAGTKKKRELTQWIDSVGGMEWLCERIASGETVTQLAREFGVSREMLSGWMNHTTRQAQYKEAKRKSASALVDQGMEILDNASFQEATIAKHRADYRKWLASMRDDQYADSTGGTVHLSIDALHIGALQHANKARLEKQVNNVIEHDDSWAD